MANVVFNTVTSGTLASDLTGDGFPDLLAAGASSGIYPSGIWLASGQNNGQISPNATNLGVNGVPGNATPKAFDGGTVISGNFTTSPLQSLFVYYPNPSLPNAGYVLTGTGDGSALQTQSSQNVTPVDRAYFQTSGGYATQVVNAGNSSHRPSELAELIGTTSGTAGALTYYYGATTSGGYNYAIELTSATTPGGDYAWDQWTLASAQLSTGTALFLWEASTGELDLWKDLSVNVDAGTITYTPFRLRASGWNPSTTLTLQAADIDSDGNPALWSIGAGGVVTANLVTNLTPGTAPAYGTGTITAQAGQTLVTAQHSWSMSDRPASAHDGDIPSPTDSVSGLNLTAAASGVGWSSGDLYDPDIVLTGSSTGSVLSTATAAVTTNANFSVSAWVKPAATGGVVLSQDANTTTGFKLWAESSDSSWRVAMPLADGSSTWYTASAAANTVQKGAWTQLTVSYTQASGLLKLYINGVYSASVTHAATFAATKGFQVGDVKTATNAHGLYFTGQVSQVQTWNQVIDPSWGLTPAGYYKAITPTRFLDTRSGLGAPATQVASGGSVHLQITGLNGVPSANVTAAAVTVTVTGQAGGGDLKIYPDNTVRPPTSNLNYAATGIRSNFVIVPVGANGKIDIYNSGSSADILGDVTGYFTSDGTAAGLSSYQPVTTPTRILDSRNGTGGYSTPLIGGTKRVLQVSGVGGVPSGATSVVMNFTTTNEAGNGYLRTYADGTTAPTTSGLQYQTSSIAGLSVVSLSAVGKLDYYALVTTDVIGDVVGYFTGGTTGQKYHPISYARMVDTRQDGGALGYGATRQVVQGGTVVATSPTLITNITAVTPTGAGYLVAYQDGTTRPSPYSSVNFPSGLTLANLNLTPSGATGAIDIYNASSGAHLVVDCLGYFSAG